MELMELMALSGSPDFFFCLHPGLIRRGTAGAPSSFSMRSVTSTSRPHWPLIHPDLLQLRSGFMVTKVKICRAPSMKEGPNRWLMLRGRLGVAPAG